MFLSSDSISNSTNSTLIYFEVLSRSFIWKLIKQKYNGHFLQLLFGESIIVSYRLSRNYLFKLSSVKEQNANWVIMVFFLVYWATIEKPITKKYDKPSENNNGSSIRRSLTCISYIWCWYKGVFQLELISWDKETK